MIFGLDRTVCSWSSSEIEVIASLHISTYSMISFDSWASCVSRVWYTHSVIPFEFLVRFLTIPNTSYDRIWDFFRLREQSSMRRHQMPVRCVALDGNRLVSSSDDGTTCVFDAEGKVKFSFTCSFDHSFTRECARTHARTRARTQACAHTHTLQ